MFGPELIRINELKFWKRDISSASESAFPGFFGDIFGCSTPSKKRCFGTQEFTRFLSTVWSQRRATRFDVSFQTKYSECLVISKSVGFGWGIPPAVRCFL